MPTTITHLAFVSAAAVIAVAVGSSAVPERATAQPVRQCFNAASVRGFETLRGGLVLMRAGGNRTFALETLGDCPDIHWARGIALRTFGGGSWICEGIDAQLIVPSPVGAQYCPVRAIRRLSREEARALRISLRR